VSGHARLRQARDARQLRDGQFLNVQQRQKSQAGGITQQAAMTPDQLELDDNILLSRLKDIYTG